MSEVTNISGGRWAHLVPVTALALVLSGPVSAQDLAIGGGLTVVGQGISDEDLATNDPGSVTGKDDGTGITYSIDVELEKEFESGVGFIYLIGAEGVPVYDGANADAEGGDFENQLVGVGEAWYAHTMFDIFTITLGKIDPTGFYDANEGANDETGQFLADALVNNPAILFPPYTPGMNFTLEFGDTTVLNFGVFEDDGAALAGEFEEKFVIGEVAFNYFLFDYEGNFRMTGWNSGANDKSGFAFNLDQYMWDDHIVLFSRLGFVGDATGPETETAFTLGSSFLWGGGHAWGLGWTMDSPARSSLDAQQWLETYLKFAINEDVAITGDLQLVMNPGYDADADTVAIYGFRTQVGF